jgi:diguanylate cyclase (GGDEF)-like protein
MATRDPLTGLLNKKSFKQHLDQLWAHAARAGEPLSLLLLDLDHFKRVNDEFSHSTGDVVLVEVAKTLARCVRKQDVAARWGGEEFTVILPAEDREGALQMAERLREAVQALRFEEDRPEGITISVGIATGRPGPERASDLLFEEADRAIMEAKRGGRNRCCISEG